jgi:HSP20 family molecular chaperone IbpA
MASNDKNNGIERVSDRPTVAPRVDVFESAAELLVVADMPGVTKEDLAIHIDKDTLVLEARRSDTVPGAPLAAEYRAHDYRRSFALPPGLEQDKIEARLSNGVLSVTLPKQAARGSRRIQVHSS